MNLFETAQTDDRLFSYFINEILSNWFPSGQNRQPSGQIRKDVPLYIILGLILIVATEPFKVLLRKNIGKLSLSMPRLVVACILYFLWACILVALSYMGEFKSIQTSLWIGALFYCVFAFFVWIKGRREDLLSKEKYDQNENYNELHLHRGDPIFFQPEDGENRAESLRKIWLLKEPLCCCFLSIILTFFPIIIHPLYCIIGMPLLLTSISFWFNECYQINNVWDVQTEKINNARKKNKGYDPFNSDDDFSSVA